MGSGWRPALRQSEVASTLTSETIMQSIVPRPEKSAAIRTDFGAIFVSLELSRSTWLITSLSPGSGEKMSKPAGKDTAIDAIPVANDISRRLLPPICLGQLPGNPFGARLRGYSQPQKLTTTVSQDQE